MVTDVGRRGAFILQKDLTNFEQHLAEFVGARRALGVGNATDGLHFAVRAAGIGPGDEVILSSHTMIATAAAVHFAGARAIPVECGADHLIDPIAVEAAITPYTRAIMPTQLNGRTCDMDALDAIARKHGLVIIEDAAQALGSKFKGQCAGTFGIASAISFYPAKVLGCLGDGGAAITNDDADLRADLSTARPRPKHSWCDRLVGAEFSSRQSASRPPRLPVEEIRKRRGRRRKLAASTPDASKTLPRSCFRLPPTPIPITSTSTRTMRSKPSAAMASSST